MSVSPLIATFWNIVGVAWFTGHVQYNVRGYSDLSTEETWSLSRFWAKGKAKDAEGAEEERL